MGYTKLYFKSSFSVFSQFMCPAEYWTQITCNSALCLYLLGCFGPHLSCYLESKLNLQTSIFCFCKSRVFFSSLNCMSSDNSASVYRILWLLNAVQGFKSSLCYNTDIYSSFICLQMRYKEQNLIKCGCLQCPNSKAPVIISGVLDNRFGGT